MTLDRKILAATLSGVADGRRAARRYVVAFSGGLDSAVLLHAVSKLDANIPVIALHIDHALHPDSARWAERAQAFAAALDVDCVVVAVETVDSGSGLEAAARAARYAAFERFLESGDWLLSAHHRDDQAETLLLNLLRGSGTLGLASMPVVRPLGQGLLVRPLLDVTREQLRAYASEQGLTWSEDPANADLRFDRNFLRHEVLPLLATRWPGAGKALARSADVAADTQLLLDALAADDLSRIGATETQRLPLSGLLQLDIRRQANLIRYACRQQALPLPPASRLREVLVTLLHSAADAQPVVAWPGATIRRFRDTVFLLSEAAEPIELPAGTLTPDASVDLGEGLGTLALVAVPGVGIAPEIAEAGLVVTGRRGGERLKPTQGGATRRLKSLLQEAGVLPWMRDRIPLLAANGQLVAVGDLWVDAQYQGEPGYAVVWSGKPAIV